MKSFLSRLPVLWGRAAQLRCAFLVLVGVALTAAPWTSFAHDEHADRIAPVSAEELAAAQTPEVSEGYVPPAPKSGLVEASLFAGFGPSVQQQQGVLSGKIVYMNSGHGWTFDPTYWRLQRGVGNEMNEDYGNLDQLNFFAQYCFNAGATVVSMRPLGHQTNEVILDNDSPG
jgi:hypothetical protein